MYILNVFSSGLSIIGNGRLHFCPTALGLSPEVPLSTEHSCSIGDATYLREKNLWHAYKNISIDKPNTLHG